MNTSYIYSATRVTSLGNELLSQNDIDRLLVATPGVELETALKETYLAPYILQVDNEDMDDAIEKTLVEAKELIEKIAPDGSLFSILWVQHDIHNLRVFAKATANNLSYDLIESYTSARGMYDSARLYESVEAGSLDSLQRGWQAAYDTALQHVAAGELHLVDAVFDNLFFTSLAHMATEAGDVFIQQYVKTTIDLYNLKNRLRIIKLVDTHLAPTFVAGGSFPESALIDNESVRQTFQIIAADFFIPALDTYEETGNTTELDARIDDYLITQSKLASVDLFSTASLVLYYLQVRQAAANVRTIVVGRNNGMDEQTIRTNVRTAYVNK